MEKENIDELVFSIIVGIVVSKENTNRCLVRHYPPEEQTRDDLRELLAEVDDHFSALDRAIHDAGNYRVFFLTFGFLRDATMPGYTFVVEWDNDTRLWTVGYKRKRRSGKWAALQDILLQDAKLDTAIGLLMQVWQTWVEEEKGTGT
jgi:hypothetical protein